MEPIKVGDKFKYRAVDFVDVNGDLVDVTGKAVDWRTPWGTITLIEGSPFECIVEWTMVADQAQLECEIDGIIRFYYETVEPKEKELYDFKIIRVPLE